MKFLAVFVTFPQSIISLFRTVQCSNLHKMMFLFACQRRGHGEWHKFI